MTDAILVEGLSKKYTIGHQAQEGYATFRDSLASGLRSTGSHILAKLAGKPLIQSSRTEEFWALKDIEFGVKQGDRVGVIGRNGAGKSTLLKILSRITEPTSGRATINGRVASLLEVGTGFHPELTGRENIFLNGAILGMSKAEILRKFDEIVEFSGVERFLDTPVKRYSSGMHVRLAFAVAAHLEPEILIIDEVLAVGDSGFQKKCLGKMEDVGREGRTVLFVSHNMASVQNLCTSCLFLEDGKIRSIGDSKDVIGQYVSSINLGDKTELAERKDRKGSGEIVFDAVSLVDAAGNSAHAFSCGETACFGIDVISKKNNCQKNVVIGFGINSASDTRIATLSNDISGQEIEIESGKSRIQIRIPDLPLAPGRYQFTLFMSANGTITDWIQNAGSFFVEGSDFYGTGRIRLGQGDVLLRYDYQPIGGK